MARRDFIADTGDDATVSEAVARLPLSAEYEVDGEVLPRGDVLVHGGDLAYPVATVREVTRRLIGPFNRVFEPLCDWSKPRVLLAIPGNHDWYDGLDGFRAPLPGPVHVRGAALRARERAAPRAQRETPILAWARAFASGKQVQKPRLDGDRGLRPGAAGELLPPGRSRGASICSASTVN